MEVGHASEEGGSVRAHLGVAGEGPVGMDGLLTVVGRIETGHEGIKVMGIHGLMQAGNDGCGVFSHAMLRVRDHRPPQSW